MNPSGVEGAPQPQFELPAQPENRPAGGELKSDKALERNSPSEGAVGRQQQPQVDNSATSIAVPSDQTVVGDDATAAPAAHHISDDTAKDGDIIEKVWINKAKTIIAHTQNDPFEQKIEMSRVKADYIQKRYNKTIPVDDPAAK